MPELEIDVREGAGKGVARRLRAAGRIPGICYGAGRRPLPVSLDPRSLERILKGSESGINTLIDLKVSGGGDYDGGTVLVRDLQRDPVGGAYLHADLFALDLTHTIEVAVPIHVDGLATGVEFSGGILDHSLRELQLECLPRAIPDEIRIDVTALEIGHSLHVRDLELPEGVTLRSDADLPVVSVVAPRIEAEPTAEVAEGEEAEAAEGEAAPAAGEEKAEGKDKEEGGD